MTQTNAKNSNKLVVDAVVLANAQAVIKKANSLAEASKKYETETLARSNKELYGILGQVWLTPIRSLNLASSYISQAARLANSRL